MTLRLCPFQLIAVLLLLAGCARTETVEQSCLEHAAAKNLPASDERAYYERCLKDLTPTREELDRDVAWQKADRHCKIIAKAEFARAWSQSIRKGVEQGFAAGTAKKAAYEECMLQLRREALPDAGGSTVGADNEGRAACLAVFDRLVADNKRKGSETIDKMKKNIANLNLDMPTSQDLTLKSVGALESANELIEKIYEQSLQLCLEGKIAASEWYRQAQTLPQP